MLGRTMSHYRILERIGRGGMSVVYKALDLKLSRPVAMKFLPPHLVNCEDAVARFFQEARAISAVNHPHIATIYELGQRQGEIFLVLEYLPGGTLRSLIHSLSAAGTVMSPKQVFQFATEIGDGLSHAHRQGIIHRDVKSDNVMLTAEGTVKITDFGLAKLRGGLSLTQTGSIIGTVSYMSPEQARGLAVDHRTDIFSFGVVLYEMATGELPFRGPHDAAILSEILHSQPSDVCESRTDLPAGFGRIVGRALEKEPGHRYQNLKELLADLRALAPQFGSEAAYDMSEAATRGLPPLVQEGTCSTWWRRFAGTRTWLRAALLSGLVFASAASLAPRWGNVQPLADARALSNHDRPVERKDPRATVHVTLGLMHAARGHYNDAIREFKTALSLDPVNAGACRELAKAYDALGKDEEAESAYRKAIELRSSDSERYNDLGEFYRRRGRFEEAADCYRKAIELAPAGRLSGNGLP